MCVLTHAPQRQDKIASNRHQRSVLTVPVGQDPAICVASDIYAMPGHALSSIKELRNEIDMLDQEIYALVRRRTTLSRCIGEVRAATDGPRIVESREREIRCRYGALGMPGYELAALLLRLGRGPHPEAEG